MTTLCAGSYRRSGPWSLSLTHYLSTITKIFVVPICKLKSMAYIQDNRALTGCAGWSHISGDSPFSEMQGSQLERYASVLPAVEINSSFYRAHRPCTYERWASSVPDAFRFSVKLPKTVTHGLRLHNASDLMAKFNEETAGLGEKLGCVLVQLPPSLHFDPAVADRFFENMQQSYSCMIACEARHATWFGADATAMLKLRGITRVVADPPKGQSARHEATTSAVYMRLHGSPRTYYSTYTDAFLKQLADETTTLLSGNQPVWLIFDNTAAGGALTNAMALLGALDVATPQP